MKTDIPLKRVTQLCPADLLTWVYGHAPASAVAVETLNLPRTETSLDTLIRLRHPAGHDYLHLIEWQGYPDPHFLWRLISYLGWLGQNRSERPILATAIYLTPADEPQDNLDQRMDGVRGWSADIPSIRLWEQDAYAALASNAPGLIALAPLMHGADTALVEAAARSIMQRTEQPTRGELLTALGTFAEPLMPSQRFLQLVQKEHLMASGLIATLFQDEFTAIEAEKQALLKQKDELVQQKDELVQRQDELTHSFQQALHHALALRYPTAPAQLFDQIAQVRAAQQLQQLLDTILTAPDLAQIQQAVATVVPTA